LFDGGVFGFGLEAFDDGLDLLISTVFFGLILLVVVRAVVGRGLETVFLVTVGELFFGVVFFWSV